MKNILIIICSLVCLTPSITFANDYDQYFDYVGINRGIEPDLLRAIAIVESKQEPWALNCKGKAFYPNDEQQAFKIIRQQGLLCDVGIMQINYSYNGFRMNLSITQLFDVYTNINTAVTILKENMSGTKNVWVAVGRYHQWKNKKRSALYAKKVRKEYLKLIEKKGI